MLRRVLALFILIPVSGYASTVFETHEDISLSEIDRDTTKHKTFVSPSFQIRIVDSINFIYGSSFEISWNALQTKVFKAPIKFSRDIWWVNELNARTENNSLSKEYYVVHAGFAKDGVRQRFQKELRDRFNYNYVISASLSPTDICSFSFMRKNISFSSNMYQIHGRNLVFNGESEVEFFGLNGGWPNPNSNSKIKIIDYLSDDDFILQLVADDDLDEIYFAKIQPEVSLIETYNIVMSRVRKGKVIYLDEKDRLGIPYIKFRTSKEFDEIVNANITNKGYETYKFSKVVQMIDFDLNETGISVESIAESYATFGIPRKVEPRILDFDKPFLIVMKEKSSDDPYYLMWVANVEMMRRK